jgi:spore maturation protein SpmB
MRYYQAAQNLLVPNSELGLMIQASMHGAKGMFDDIKRDHGRVTVINDLAQRCKRSTSVTLVIIGQLLLALTEDNLMLAK